MMLTNVKNHTASRKRFVLVVDSDVRTLFYTSALLKRFQYDVCTARTGTEAMEVADVVTPVLIVTAQFLNDMPGLDLIKKIKESERSRNVAMIALTRGTDRGNERCCLEAGAITCLRAPAAVEDLYRVVQIAVEPVPRMNVRVDTRLPVSISSRDVDCGEGLCARALSEHGVYVRTRQAYPLNARLPLRIDLGDAPFSAEAVVLYNDGDGDQQRGMGLQFENISQHDRQRLRSFIRQEIIKGIAL